MKMYKLYDQLRAGLTGAITATCCVFLIIGSFPSIQLPADGKVEGFGYQVYADHHIPPSVDPRIQNGDWDNDGIRNKNDICPKRPDHYKCLTEAGLWHLQLKVVDAVLLVDRLTVGILTGILDSLSLPDEPTNFRTRSSIQVLDYMKTYDDLANYWAFHATFGVIFVAAAALCFAAKPLPRLRWGWAFTVAAALCAGVVANAIHILGEQKDKARALGLVPE